MADTVLNGSASPLTQWGKFVTLVGVPSVIALFLVWVGATEIPRLARETEANRVQSEVNREQLREIRTLLDEQLRLTRWICAGVNSGNEADRRECFEK